MSLMFDGWARWLIPAIVYTAQRARENPGHGLVERRSELDRSARLAACLSTHREEIAVKLNPNNVTGPRGEHGEVENDLVQRYSVSIVHALREVCGAQ